MPDRFYAFYVHLKWPSAGRAEELRIIEAAMSDRDSSGIVIGGAAGVGKSRLAREALNVSGFARARMSMGTRHILGAGASAGRFRPVDLQ